MPIQFYNSLSRTKEIFTPLHAGEVRMYCCGPTVYNYAHIGNLRAYVFNDLLRRYLKYKGFKLSHVMNITDVDDKTIRDSQREGRSLKEFTVFYTERFLEDLRALRIEMPDVMPRATDEIDGMVSLIVALLKSGHAYKNERGDIYFRIRSYPRYGALANIDLSRLRENASGRLAKADEYSKEDANDFALWKSWDEADGPVFWETEIGKGRPGWHIECSAMSARYLGQPFDIHTGGVDLIFPHHTNEMAQSECATGKEFARFWLHNEHLIVNGKKMSKSAGNFFTLRQLLDKGYSPISIRYELLRSHYRLQLDFREENLSAHIASIERFHDFITKLKARLSAGGKPSAPWSKIIAASRKRFAEALDDDLGISGALSCLFELVSEGNKSITSLTAPDAEAAISLLQEFDSVLGFVMPEEQALSPELQQLIAEREEARKAKDFAKSDALRTQLLNQGVVVKDTPQGTQWFRR